MFFFSKGLGIKHRLREHVMADIRHKFHFYLLCNGSHTQAQQKRCQNDDRLRRIGGSSIVICLIQREVISVNLVKLRV